MSELRSWAIMSKDRTWIAAGSTRNRYLVKVADLKSGKVKKRILLYGTMQKAIQGFKSSGFYQQGDMMIDICGSQWEYGNADHKSVNDILEPVAMRMSYE